MTPSADSPRILTPSFDSIAFAAEQLQRGEIIGLPTETVYGLAGNGLNIEALARIFAAKERPLFDPLILHLAETEAAWALAQNIPAGAATLAAKFWPGPLTLILQKRSHVPDLATSGLPTVALRVPAHPVAQAVLQAVDFPLAAPSANRFGRISPTTAYAVLAELGDRVSLILDGGPCAVGVESTVVDFSGTHPFLRRAGGIPVEDLEACLGQRLEKAEIGAGLAPQAPGELRHHYAPRKPLYVVAHFSKIPQTPETGWLAFGPEAEAFAFVGVKNNLSVSGHLQEAATRFFSLLRALDDHPQVSQIFVLALPEKGLGRAINERLTRARTD